MSCKDKACSDAFDAWIKQMPYPGVLDDPVAVSWAAFQAAWNRRAPEWQPIESAPKDGTYILLGARCGTWIGKYKHVYQSGYKPENPWASMMLNHDHMGEKWQAPTHWMPLPASPQPDGREG